jgi:hypothetical protein
MTDYPDVQGDWQAAVRFQQAYAEMAFLCYGIPVGDSIIVTSAQDAFLCESAVEYMQDLKEQQS